MRKIIAILLVLCVAISSLGFESIVIANALDVGNSATITNIKFIKQHNGYDVTGGNIIIIGTKLEDINVLFEVEGGIPKTLGTKDADSNDFFLNYKLNFEEADSFTGKIYIGNKVIDLNTPNFPNITSSDKAVINQDLTQQLKLNGSKLDLINNTSIKATYGRGIQQNNITQSAPVTQQPNAITFTPTAPGPLGYQDITLTQKVAGDPEIDVTYYYKNAFRILQDLDLSPMNMYPNAASKGDLITLTSPKFSDAKNYAVYFLNITDSDFAFSDDKKSPSVILSADKQRLTVKVPDNANISLGSKRIVIVDVVNKEIVSRYDLSETFNLIDAAFKPTIIKINPNSGTDEGAKAQIIGRNIISPVIPELNSTTGKINIVEALPANGNKEMRIDYDESGVTFKGVNVTSLKRTVRTIIAKQTFYELDANNRIKYSKIGADDYLYIMTDVIDDAAKDPEKDVVLEIETEIKDANGKTYTFSQSATVKDGFKFIPSSIEPNITAVTPTKVQINQTFNPKETTLFAIEGDNFLVNKYTDTQGNIHTNYPVVQIQITDTLGDGDYIVKLDKNDKTGSPQGSVYDSAGVKVGTPVDMVVLNDKGELVDGSVGNDIGKKIIVYIPKNISVSSGGKKNIQVINPKRNSNNLGTGYVALDIVDFVVAPDTPVIESVEPNIITADSKEEIVITGSNFQDGVKVLIDGVDVGTIKREIGAQGNNVKLTFNAPIGRVTKTQIQVLNPLGGIAVRDFYYVRSFNQDPSITKIAPNKGTVDTLSIVSGDNFFKPDAGAKTDAGLDAYRLIGTRVLFDGKDINTYNLNVLGDIDFVPYTAPDSNIPLFSNEAGKIKVTPFYKNIVVTDSADKDVYAITFDADGNPQFYNGNEVVYTFKYSDANGYRAYKADGTLVGQFSFTPTSVTVTDTPQKIFKVRMDNKLIRAHYSLDKKISAELADYWPSIILKDDVSGEYYTLQKRIDGTLRLSDGQFNIFDIKTTGTTVDTPVFKAVDKASNAYDVTPSATGITVNTPTPLNLKMLTPYVYDSATKEITGNRVRVETKDKLRIRVPSLISSTGYKNVTVVNPDTKSATLKDGFYYYKLPATKPKISKITPNLGAVAGGYVVSIEGKDFNDTTQIYFDGILVPPSDKKVNLSGTSIDVKVPAYPFDITEKYGVGKITVPVVLTNSDGGSAQLEDGFTYVKPTSTPKIKEIVLASGSTNGGEVVEILGEDFRFFEPYENLGGGVGYDKGIDTYTNVNGKLNVPIEWDDLLKTRYKNGVDLWEQKPMPNGASFFGYNYYYSSPILPRIYFGGKLAKIVDFDNGYIKVITPANTPGAKDIIVMNNDAGVSNTVTYTYNASSPQIKYINPSQGARTGGEQREVIGSSFAKDAFKAYQDDDANTIVRVSEKVQALVRFGDITNENIKIGSPNDGRINANRATVSVEGGLTVTYDGNAKSIVMSLQEGGVIYRRTFTNYTTGPVFIPTGMLKNDVNFYQPVGYGYTTPTVFNAQNDYEWVQVNVDPNTKRLFVSRGFAPKVRFENAGQLVLMTPAYHTIDKVKVTFFNPDGGKAESEFEFTNPASKPIIEYINPSAIIPPNSVENKTDKEQKMVQASIQGGVNIEIKGRDFRDGVKVFLGTKQAEVRDIIVEKDTGLQVIIAQVPKADAADIGTKLPIIVQNTDGGIANSTDTTKLGSDKRLIYFIYRKPLSLPKVEKIVPNKTSQFGGNTIEIKGTDLRSGARVIIGSVGGVPVTPFEIEDVGRYIKFKVPSTLTPGAKDIQVINSDYGTVTLNDGLTIISYPTLETSIYGEDERRVTTLNTEGNQVITIKGTNFQDGAKVIFGGERVEKKEGVTGEEGFYKDDKTYVIKDGVVAPKVEYIDENTLKVTTPKMSEEKDYTLTVINPDTGLSDNGTKIKYNAPVPAAPTTLKVATVDKQYIKLYDYVTENIKYYEIYVYIGNKSVSQLINNKYRDFKSLGTTTFSPYKITRLDGLDTMKQYDKIHFVVKAVNEHGASKFSNIAYLNYKEVNKIETLGGEDQDGGLLPTIKEISETEYLGDKLRILFTDDRFSYGTILDLRRSEFKTMNTLDVIMPDSMVLSNGANMYITTDLLDVTYAPRRFLTTSFKENNTSSKEYVTWTTDWKDDASTSSALGRLPRGVKVVSPTAKFSFTIANNTGVRNIGTLASPLDVSFNLNSQKIKVKTGKFSVYYYNPATRIWRKVETQVNTSENKVNFKVPAGGYFVLTVPY